MNVAILSVGTELATGQCLDTNSQWLSTELGRIGAPVTLHLTVGDDADDLVRAIRYARDVASVVILTGGLGPTEDDLTREAAADAIAEPLEERADALRQIEEMFRRWQRPMPAANRVQARIPRGCRVLPNSCGTAPGFAHQSEDRWFFALPGVPREMKEMFRQSVLPELQARSGGACIETRCLRCFGLGEASLGEKIRDLMARGRNPSVGTTASDAIITIRLVARAADASEARRLLDRDALEIRGRLAYVVFGEGDATLHETVGRMLIEHRKTVATAESCTGGLLAARLTDVPGSSAYFLRGMVTYANEAKVRMLGVSPALIESDGAVSEPVARAMAEGCRSEARSDYAMAVTGIAGPSGGSTDKPVGLVYLALADHRGVDVRRHLFAEWLSRAEIRDRACKTALNWMRLRLIGAEG